MTDALPPEPSAATLQVLTVTMDTIAESEKIAGIIEQFQANRDEFSPVMLAEMLDSAKRLLLLQSTIIRRLMESQLQIDDHMKQILQRLET